MSDARPAPKNPFRGLTPFQEGDELFGRDRDLIVFEDRMYSARTTLLFAGSGVGKSSFLNAKVLPALKHDHCVVRHARWGARAPLEGLRESWTAALAEYLWARPQLRRDRAFDASQTPAQLLDSIRNRWDTAESPLQFARHFAALDTVMLLDQFEEPLNSLVYDAAVDALIEALSALINDTALPLRVVLSMRQEFLAELSLFEHRVPDLFANYYNLRHPSPHQAEVIISSTVDAAGATYDESGVAELVRDLQRIGGHRHAGQDAAAPPLRFVVPTQLQQLCSSLWNENAEALVRREAAFAAGYSGGRARSVLHAFVEQQIARLDDAQKVLLAKALDFLVARQGGKLANEVAALAAELACDRDELDAALAPLASEPDRVLRRIQKSDGTTWYELYHDIYATALTTWKANYEAQRELQATAEAAERAREAQVRVVAEKKKSKWTTVLGCTTAALFFAVIGTCSTAMDAREHRRALVEAGDDYGKARAAYDEVHGNFIKTLFGWFDADEELAKFWDRRTRRAALLESRDSALVYALEALATNDTPERRRGVAQIVGDDLSEIVATYHASDPIVALSRDGERYATLGRGGVVVRSVEKPGGAVLQVPRVEFTDVVLSDDGNVVWALGKRAAESKSKGYEQKNANVDEGEFGLWTRRVDRPEEAPRAWVGAGEFAQRELTAWSISADGSAAVCAWARETDARVRAFGDFGRAEPGACGPVESAARPSRTAPWQVAVRPDGAAVAFQEPGGALIEIGLRGAAARRTLASDAPELAELCYSPDGKLLAGTERDSESLRVLDLTVDPPTPRAPQMQAVGFDTFDASGRRAYCRNLGWLEAWDVDTGTLLGRISDPVLSQPVPLATGGSDAPVFGWSSGHRTWLARYSADLSRLEWSRYQFESGDEHDGAFAPRGAGAECVAVVEPHTLRRIASRPRPGSDAPPWNGWTTAVLARGGQRALVRDNQRFALVDASTGKVLSDVVDVRAEDVQLSLDFDAKGQRAFALVGESIRELESGAAIDVGRLSAIARIFAVGDGDRLLVEANDALWLVPTAGGGGARRVASTSGGDVMRSVALDLERRHAAVVTWSDEEHSAVDVIDLATGDAARVLERRAYLDVIALASPATRIAVVEPIGDDGERSSLVVVDVASGKSLTQDAIPLGEEPIALAFSPDGNAVVARTPHALVRVGLEDVAAAPRVRYLRRASVVLETVPNWFDADDPKGERPRVIVIDETGRIALERVRFDDADVAPIVGASDALRAQWQRRLDLQIDGNGIAVPSSGSTGGGF